MSKLIYKYYRINEYLFDLLISNQLYFSSIKQFNDPYDCHFSFKEIPTYEHFDIFLKQFITKEENRQFYLDLYKKNPEKCMSPIFDAMKARLDYSGICCFAKKKENFLMWSHYSDSHRGVCLGFDYDELTKQFGQYDNVEYENEPYFFDITNISKSIEKAILRKSTDWKYEEEVRFLMERNKACGFNMTSLREINFGLKSPTRQMVSIMYLVNKLGYANCSFYKANIATSNYSIAFEKANFEELKKTLLKDSEKIPFTMEINFEEKNK